MVKIISNKMITNINTTMSYEIEMIPIKQKSTKDDIEYGFEIEFPRFILHNTSSSPTLKNKKIIYRKEINLDGQRITIEVTPEEQAKDVFFIETQIGVFNDNIKQITHMNNDIFTRVLGHLKEVMMKYCDDSPPFSIKDVEKSICDSNESPVVTSSTVVSDEDEDEDIQWTPSPIKKTCVFCPIMFTPYQIDITSIKLISSSTFILTVPIPNDRIQVGDKIQIRGTEYHDGIYRMTEKQSTVSFVINSIGYKYEERTSTNGTLYSMFETTSHLTVSIDISYYTKLFFFNLLLLEKMGSRMGIDFYEYDKKIYEKITQYIDTIDFTNELEKERTQGFLLYILYIISSVNVWQEHGGDYLKQVVTLKPRISITSLFNSFDKPLQKTILSLPITPMLNDIFYVTSDNIEVDLSTIIDNLRKMYHGDIPKDVDSTNDASLHSFVCMVNMEQTELFDFTIKKPYQTCVEFRSTFNFTSLEDIESYFFTQLQSMFYHLNQDSFFLGKKKVNKRKLNSTNKRKSNSKNKRKFKGKNKPKSKGKNM